MAGVYLKLIYQYSIHSNNACSIYSWTYRTPPITILAIGGVFYQEKDIPIFSFGVAEIEITGLLIQKGKIL